jgi:hypothetical protein
MKPDESKGTLDRMAEAYDMMLKRVDVAMEQAEHSASDRFSRALDYAREKSIELDELSREEAERISDYLHRDVNDAARYLAETGEEFRQWLRFDIELIEGRLFDAFASVADKTRIELEQWAEAAREASIYHTGEMTGPGALVCEACGKVMHFHKAGHIPPCPACSNTQFVRQTDEGDTDQ